IVLSRFASTFAMMYASGISVIETLRITEHVVGNAVVREAIHDAGQRIEEGQNITLAFQSVGMFPPLVIRMLRVGENSGALDTALENVSYFYNRDVRESIERLQTLIEPALTVIIGCLLGWVILSVLGPIYDLITKLKYYAAMTERRTLILPTQSLSVWHWQHNNADRECEFSLGESGQAEFRLWLQAHLHTLFHLLVDLPDEGFHQESLPHVSGPD